MKFCLIFGVALVIFIIACLWYVVRNLVRFVILGDILQDPADTEEWESSFPTVTTPGCYLNARTREEVEAEEAKFRNNTVGLPQYAIAFYGGVSALDSSSSFKERGAFESSEKFINITVVAAGWRKHVMGSFNGGRDNFDIYIHSWAWALENEMHELYSFKKASFEPNSKRAREIKKKFPLGKRNKICRSGSAFCPYGVPSSALSQREVLQMVADGERARGFQYVLVILCRPDVLMWKEMLLSRYNPKRVTVNGIIPTGQRLGDWHFVFGSDLLSNFAKAYDWLNPTNFRHWQKWGWRTNYVENYVTPGLPIIEDDFFSCAGHMVLRMLCTCFQNLNAWKSICPTSLISLGMSGEEVHKLTSEGGQGAFKLDQKFCRPRRLRDCCDILQDPADTEELESSFPTVTKPGCYLNARTRGEVEAEEAKFRNNTVGLPQYAIAFYGCMSAPDWSSSFKEGEAFESSEKFINITVVAAGWRKHVMGSFNGGRDNFDIYIHSWAWALEKKMHELYSFKKASFESNLKRARKGDTNKGETPAWLEMEEVPKRQFLLPL